MSSGTYDRQIPVFGKEGQKRIQEAVVSIVGVGGTGSHVVQQLAYLGVGKFILVDEDIVEDTNLNRMIGAEMEDVENASYKVEVMKRMIGRINPKIEVISVQKCVTEPEALDALKEAQYIFGCLDHDGPRVVLTEFSLAYEIPYFDVSSEVLEDGEQFGGQVFFMKDNGCLACRGYLNGEEVTEFFESTEAKKDRHTIYGVDKDQLNGSGPSVVMLNGLIASIAVMEFSLYITGKKLPSALLTYWGPNHRLSKNNEDPENDDCYYCGTFRATGDEFDIKKYQKD